MTFYKGTTTILYIKQSGIYYPIGCLTDNSFAENIETLDKANNETGGWSSYDVLNQGFEISFNAIFDDSQTISYNEIKTLKRSRTLIEWKIEDSDKRFVDFGSGYFTQVELPSSIDEFITFSGTILGYGQPTSTSELTYVLGDGNGNSIEDGNGNEILTA